MEGDENTTVNAENTVQDGMADEWDVARDADRHQKFLDMSADCIRKAVTAIEKIGKCSNRKQYDFTTAEVEKMFEVLQESLDDTKAMFKERKTFSW